MRMFGGGRRVTKWQFVQLCATCFLLSLMVFWGPLDTRIVSHVKSYSYRYLINSYAFVNDSLSLSRPPDAAGFRYLINHRDKCRGQDVLLVLFVKSSPENRRRRDAIRRTWGNDRFARARLNANVKTLFALGSPGEPLRARRERLQRELWAEDREHRDLIQQDFADTFHNLTLKLLLQLGWVHAHCAHARFVMSADDDIFLHLPNLIEYLRAAERGGARDLWVGRVHRGSPPVRDKSSKYFVPYEMYQWPAYPDYTAGAAYVVSGRAAAKVYEAARTLNSSLYIDDVFMGLCANKVKIVPQHHVFFSGEGKAPYHPCIYEKMITSHGHLQDLQDLWEAATDSQVKAISRGFLGQIYCRVVKIMLLCKIKYVDTYPCRAAFY